MRELSRLARELARARPEVEDVVLFGSLASGRARPGSDADLLVIVRESPERFLDRMLTYGPYFRAAPIACEVLPYTRAEVEANGRQPGIVRSALRTGKSLLR